MSENIQGKVVVITGGSGGIGRSTARHLASHGAKIAVAGQNFDRMRTVVGEIVEAGGAAKAFSVDVTKRAEVESMVAGCLAEFGRVDVLVSNAGVMAIAPMSEGRTDEWDRMIDINIKGVLYGIAAVMPVFLKQASGPFINIASAAGIKVFSPGGTVYSGTKFAVRAISEGLRHEVGGSIRTTIISPGAIDTDLKRGSSHAESIKAVNAFYEQAIPPDSVARAIAYAIQQPADVDINEIVLRPTVQEF